MDTYEPQGIEELAPNLNSWTGTGKVSKVEPLTGKTPGLAFTMDYKKIWPNGGTDIWPIRCYVSGAERVEKLKTWLKSNEVVVIRGELTNRSTIYAHVVEPWNPLPKDAFDEDNFPMPGGKGRR
jgi:hypothetical protein